MFVTTDEIKTHLGAELVDVISIGDETLLTAAIDGAQAEAKGYLTAYDVDAIFTATGSNRNALLLIFVKDIAVWHFINICNAGTSLEFRRSRYNSAIDWLKAVQKGNVTPDFPVKKDEAGNVTNETPFKIGSNPKRGNYI